MDGEYFVFVVYDPRATNTPIWVGHGTGDACNTFLTNPHTRNPVLYRTMREYRAAGLKPKAKIVKRFATRDEARALKKKLIHKYGRSDIGTGTLLNLIGQGYTSGKTPTFIEKRKRTAERLAAIAARKAARAARSLSAED